MAQERPTHPSKFFNSAEKAMILKKIKEAEARTSGEIRVHVEKKCKTDPMKRATQLFAKLKMHKTAQRNGTLIYLATEDRKFVVLGDKGIDEKVPDNFWNEVVDKMGDYFKRGEFCEGLCWGIEKIGEKLKTYFPHQADDVNELSDEISEGE